LDPRISALKETVDVRVKSLEQSLSTRIDALEKRIPVIEEIAVIKVRLSDLERRVQPKA